MSEMADNATGLLTSSEGEEPSAMERRIFRSMCWIVALGVATSGALMPWRVTTGLLLGGSLALFSHHWLRTSVAAIFSATPAGARPKMKAARYILRYFVMAAAVIICYQLDLVSIVATLAGMCVFVAAALVEGSRQLYIAIVHREET
jgi:ATP synthase I chain